jgi:hypothetical protein
MRLYILLAFFWATIELSHRRYRRFALITFYHKYILNHPYKWNKNLTAKNEFVLALFVTEEDSLARIGIHS